MGPGSVLQLFSEMLRVYFKYAWPFFLMHCAIAAAIAFGPMREIIAERKRLRQWKKNGQSDAGCAGVLTQFVRDSRQWGSRGILVPMTDYSDRLDSHVNGVIETLHSRVNLFLVIGIAGTFFAMFQFAVEAARGFETAERMSRLLATGLAQAFPVGFVGLMLTIAGHFLAFFMESALRASVTDATQHAMQARRESAQGPYDVILEALAPLRNLEETLRTGLQPMLTGFRDHLQAASELIQREIQPLAQAVAGFQSAVRELRPVSETLTLAVQRLPTALERIEAAQGEARRELEAMHQAQAEARQAAQSFIGQMEPACRQLEEAAVHMNGAAASMERVPEEVRAQMELQLGVLGERASQMWLQSARSHQSEIEKLGTESVAVWERTGHRLLTELGQSFETHLSDIQRAANTASGRLAEAARQISDLSNTAQATLEGALGRFVAAAAGELKPALAGVDEALQTRLPVVLEGLRAAAVDSHTLRSNAAEFKREMAEIIEALVRAQERWSGAARELERAFTRLRPPEPPPASEVAGIRAAVERIAARVAAPRRQMWRSLWPFNGRNRK